MGSRQENSVSLEAVLQIVASHVGLSPAEVSGDRSLPDLGVSSFGMMGLVLALEEQFEMEFSGDELREFTTLPVARLFELVQRGKGVVF